MTKTQMPEIYKMLPMQHSSVIIQGSASGDRTLILAEKYLSWLKKGIEPEKILVLVLNSYKKSEFIKLLRKKEPALKHNICTLHGLCSKAFIDNWEFVSSLAKKQAEGNFDVPPNLCGLDVSQYIFKESIKTADFSDYISKINLLHQLFRRYSLIVNGCFSNKEVLERAYTAGESFAQDAQKAIDDYKLKTFQYNSFDYLRQLAVLPLICRKTDYFKNIEYFIADDADEYSYAYFKFIDKIMPDLKDYAIGFDEKGSSRCGYLCAYKSGMSDFIKKYQPEIIPAGSGFTFPAAVKQQHISGIKRLDMLKAAVNKIKILIKQGVKRHEIAVITPILDEILYEYFNAEHIKFQVLSGSEKLADDTAVKIIIISLKLINGIKISEYENKYILLKLLKLPYKEIISMTAAIDKEKINPENAVKYFSVIETLKKSKNTLSEQIKILKENLFEYYGLKYDAEKYNFFLKEAVSFETAFKGFSADTARDYIISAENSIISENPASAPEIKKDRIIAATPQKIIDYTYKTKYQFYLDASSDEWIKNDTGTLYNAWVLSRDFKGRHFTQEDNIELTKDKTKRIIRKLAQCAEKEILFFSSMYDNTGSENNAGITEFIEPPENKPAAFAIVPRKDQLSVLKYASGRFGVTAAPGAGKTTILLALVIKLMNAGVKPENIFVLTYMESAAKNFKERLKNSAPDCRALPNISTIHGLALRIIKENGNYVKLGLEDNFEICDDNMKEFIIRSLFIKFKIDEDNYDNYVKCISELKTNNLKADLKSQYKEIQAFYDFYAEYNKYLKQNNLIDYDDMIYYAVKLLEDYPDIRKHYQHICRYIIEDEAQDSGRMQQQMTEILSAEYNNLIRCGDINQSITSTFTNSNPKGFKSFVMNNSSAEMNISQRSSKYIYTLANMLVKEALKISDKTGAEAAFYNIEIQGTDKNPKNNNKPEYIIFENEREEKDFIIKKIKEIQKETPKASIAVLLRLNAQAEEYSSLLYSEQIQTSIQTGCAADKLIYKIIYAVLNIINNPLENKNITETAQLLCRNNISSIKQSSIDYLETLKEPFIMLDIEKLELEGLQQLYFDIDYFLNNSAAPADIIAASIGEYYSRNDTDKSNAYMISAMIKRLQNEFEPETCSLKQLLSRLDYAAHKSSGLYKFFDGGAETSESVKIMTMHKSKGAEFDYVFIPELNENNYASDISTVKLQPGSHFVQTIRRLITGENAKPVSEVKQELADENLRLLYTGITRAKQEVYLTNAKNYRRRKNTKPINIINAALKSIKA